MVSYSHAARGTAATVKLQDRPLVPLGVPKGKRPQCDTLRCTEAANLGGFLPVSGHFGVTGSEGFDSFETREFQSAGSVLNSHLRVQKETAPSSRF
jgi:hypothetical protein